MNSVWYPALLTILLPFNNVRVLPTPIFLKLYAPVSPLPALTPPEACSCSLKKFRPCSTTFSINSSPSLTPRASISSAERTVTGSASVIDAPLICEPTTTTSSTSESESSLSWATTARGSNKTSENKYFKFFIVSPLKNAF